MLRLLLDELGSIDVVSVFCAAELAAVYQSIGFHLTRQVVLHRTS